MDPNVILNLEGQGDLVSSLVTPYDRDNKHSYPVY